jgi:hypothetical protein
MRLGISCWSIIVAFPVVIAGVCVDVL